MKKIILILLSCLSLLLITACSNNSSIVSDSFKNFKSNNKYNFNIEYNIGSSDTDLVKVSYNQISIDSKDNAKVDLFEVDGYNSTRLESKYFIKEGANYTNTIVGQNNVSKIENDNSILDIISLADYITNDIANKFEIGASKEEKGDSLILKNTLAVKDLFKYEHFSILTGMDIQFQIDYDYVKEEKIPVENRNK